MHPLKHWLALAALVVMFGSAFLMTKVAVTDIPPLAVVAGRISIAALLLLVWAYSIGERIGSLIHHWKLFLVLSLTGNCIPFGLISWGQQYVDSSLAGILMAVMPLVAILLAHYALPNEPLTVRRVLGFLLGFAGVVILMEPQHLFLDSKQQWPWLAMVAILLGACSYAANSVLAKFLPHANLILISAIVLLFASFLTIPFAVWELMHTDIQWVSNSALSVLMLGVFPTGLATIVYFYIIRHAGPGFLSQINYLIPVWAVLIGIVFGGEKISIYAVLAMLCILSGIAIAQSRFTLVNRDGPDRNSTNNKS